MNIIKSTAYAAMLLASLSAQAAQPIINLSIGGEISPGVYGQVQFGNAPPPPVVYAQPTIIEDHGGRRLAPIYLHVPPEHAKHWAKYCHKYNACNRPVYSSNPVSMSRVTMRTRTKDTGMRATGMIEVTTITGTRSERPFLP